MSDRIDRWVERAMPYSKSGEARLRATALACLDCDERNIPGDIVECGVWRGGNIMVARWASPKRHCWLYDTFRGMTPPGPFDTNRSGMLADPKRWTGKAAVDVRDVRDNLAAVGVLED